jgi:hypothetical protein
MRACAQGGRARLCLEEEVRSPSAAELSRGR